MGGKGVGSQDPVQTIPDPDFQKIENFQKYFSCSTFACKRSNFDQIALTTEHITL